MLPALAMGFIVSCPAFVGPMMAGAGSWLTRPLLACGAPSADWWKEHVRDYTSSVFRRDHPTPAR